MKKKVRALKSDKTAMAVFKKYVNTIGYVDSTLKAEIVALINDSKNAFTKNILFMLNNSLDVVSDIVDEHAVFCLTNDILKKFSNGNELEVTYQPVYQMYNKYDSLRKYGVFDQMNSGSSMQLMGALGIVPSLSTVNTGDKGYTMMSNPTQPTHSSYIVDIFRNLLNFDRSKNPPRGAYGPSFWWLITKGFREASSASQWTHMPCNDDEIEEYKRTADMVDSESIAYITSELYGYGAGDTLPNGQVTRTVIPGAYSELPNDFFVSEKCREADINFRTLTNNTPLADINSSWTSHITVDGRTLVKFEYSPLDNSSVGIRISGDDSTIGLPMSAEEAKSNKVNIDNTMRKTAGDVNLLLYAIANGQYAITGDRSAAAMYVFFSYVLSLGMAQSDAPEPPKFIFETNAPAQNACIVSPPLVNTKTKQPEQMPISRTTFCVSTDPVCGFFSAFLKYIIAFKPKTYSLMPQKKCPCRRYNLEVHLLVWCFKNEKLK